jgi:hypothetical protein
VSASKSLGSRCCPPGGTHGEDRGIRSHSLLLEPGNIQEEAGETYTGKSKIGRVDTIETLARLVISESCLEGVNRQLNLKLT